MKIEKIAVRVYAIIVKEDQILLSDEFWFDTPMTKFPGGRLEPAEGVLDCLKREIKEELNTDIVKAEHFFTYEDFIVSVFMPSTQVIPIYYIVELADYSKLDLSNYRYDFHELVDGAIRHRWINIEELHEKELTFVSDKIALEKFKESLSNLNLD